MKTISNNLLDAGKVAELGLCPICKINYITDDETVCSTCYAETDLSDEEILEIYGENKPLDKKMTMKKTLVMIQWTMMI